VWGKRKKPVAADDAATKRDEARADDDEARADDDGMARADQDEAGAVAEEKALVQDQVDEALEEPADPFAECEDRAGRPVGRFKRPSTELLERALVALHLEPAHVIGWRQYPKSPTGAPAYVNLVTAGGRACRYPDPSKAAAGVGARRIALGER
jgi:hypothetical protein